MSKIAILLLALLMLLLQPSLAAAADWSAVGLRVSYRRVVTNVGPRTMPLVLEVQDRSPAFFAGVLPDDVISYIKCGRWGMNFIDGDPDGGVYFEAYESVGSQEVAGIRDPADRACAPGLTAIVSIMRAPGDRRPLNKMISFRTETGTGPWLSNRQGVSGSRTASREDLQAGHAQLLSQAATVLQVDACRYQPSSASGLNEHHPLVRDLADRAGKRGESENLNYWVEVQRAYCSIQRRGPLPSFETAIHLMNLRHLEPCAYDPRVDYSKRPLDPKTRTLPISRDEYETYTRFDTLLIGMFDARQTECLKQLMLQRLQ